MLISLFNVLAQWFWKEVVTNVQFTDSQRADSVNRQAHELPAQFNYKLKRGNILFLYENRLKGLLTMPEIFSLFCSLKMEIRIYYSRLKFNCFINVIVSSSTLLDSMRKL